MRPERDEHGNHVTVLGYTTDDDGVWLECSCGWDQCLGFSPTLQEVLAAQVHDHLEEPRPVIVRVAITCPCGGHQVENVPVGQERISVCRTGLHSVRIAPVMP